MSHVLNPIAEAITDHFSPTVPVLTPEQARAAAAQRVEEELRFRMMLIDAIVGVGFPSRVLGVAAENAGLATITRLLVPGHDSPPFVWNRDALAAQPLPRLQALYEALCEARDGL